MEDIKLDHKYIVAISGGVDSICLLNLLLRGTKDNSNKFIIIAHLDHGIRKESKKDRILVEKISKKYSLQFVYEEIKLGKAASEELARKYRYEFLNKIKKDFNAYGIMTAHHQDDLLETFFINLIRGTNRRGLSSLKSTPELLRPLLNYSKKEIIEYALNNKLVWNEDITNLNTNYLRNYLRIKLIPKLTISQRNEGVEIIKRQQILNEKIDYNLGNIIRLFDKNKIPRIWFNTLSLNIQKELIGYLLRLNNFSAYTNKMLLRLALLLKVSKTSAIIEVSKGIYFKVDKTVLALELPER